MITRTIYLLFIMCLFSSAIRAQELDTLVNIPTNLTDAVVDNSSVEPLNNSLSPVDSHVAGLPFITPKKVALFSSVVPGLGQYFNKDYWKVPIVYIGLGVGVYAIIYNSNKFNYYRKIHAGRANNDPKYRAMEFNYSNENIRFLRDSYRKDLDMSVLLTVAGYGVQIIDALVFAHLKKFDISDDISFRLKPLQMPQGGMGFGLVMNF